MKITKYGGLIVCCCLLLCACASSKYIVEKNPRHDNPVDEIRWLKERTQELRDTECQITLFEKEGKSYYSVYRPTPGAFDKNTTVVYDQEGKICLTFGGLMPPQRRAAVNAFFKGAQNKGVIWECKLREEKNDKAGDD